MFLGTTEPGSLTFMDNFCYTAVLVCLPLHVFCQLFNVSYSGLISITELLRFSVVKSINFHNLMG